MNRYRNARWVPLLTLLLLSASGPPVPAEGKAYDPEALQRLRVRIDAGELKEVDAEARRILAAVEKEEGVDSLAVADVLSVIVETRHNGYRATAPESLAMARRAVTITETRLGPIHFEIAKALNNLGQMFVEIGDYAEARPIYERSLSMREELLGPDNRSVAVGYNNLGVLLLRMGDLPGAISRFQKTADILERIEESPTAQMGYIYNNLGILAMEQGELDRSLAYYDRGLEIQESIFGPDHADVARTLNNKAITVELMGDYAGAMALYERCLAIRERVYEPDNIELASTIGNLAILGYKMGDLQTAVRRAQHAVGIYRKSAGPEHSETLRMVNTYGTILTALDLYDEAIPLMEGNLAAREKTLGADHQDIAESLSGLAAMYQERGEPAKALPMLERSMQIRQAAIGPTHPKNAADMLVLAEVRADLGNTDEARGLFERALAHNEQRLGTEHPVVANTLDRFGEFLWEHGPTDETLAHSRRAAQILLLHARDTLSVLPERQALLLVAGQKRPEEILFSGLLKYGKQTPAWIEASWEWSLGRRGVVLEELAERHRSALAGESAEARQAWEKLAAARRTLATLWVVSGDDRDPDAYRNDLEQAREAKERAEAELARISSSFRLEQRGRNSGIADLKRNLPAGSALVEWVRVRAGTGKSEEREWRDIALVIEPGGTTGFVDLGLSGAIDNAATIWRAALEGTADGLERNEASGAPVERSIEAVLNTVRMTGEELRRLVWDPLPESVREADRLFLIPDGGLHQVDLAALPAEDGGYLIESGPAVHLLSSGRDLVRIAGGDRSSGVQGKGLLALGDPDFDADRIARRIDDDEGPVVIAYRGATSECLAVGRTVWPPLPESGREVRQVSELFGKKEPVATLTGAAASEERFKRDAPGRRVLHLATHGFFLAQECMEAAGDSTAGGTPAQSPLLLSGLVLAGANRSENDQQAGDDGILTAEELAALDLRGVELAVLSACDTGRGAVAVNEGVFGLRRALEIAGVRTVVMSLWPIPDRQARRWMNAFYKDRREGNSISEASRQAALANLNELRERDLPDHPYRWAGIVAAGDWRWDR